MSVSGPIRPDVAAVVLPLLREWVLLREREHRLIEQIADALELMSRGGDTTGNMSDAAVPIPGFLPGGADGATGSPGDGAEDGGSAATAAGIARPVATPPDAPEGEHPGDPSWIDRTIDAVLKGAFSADPDPEAEDLPAVDLLLLRSGDIWVGVPWDSVAGLGLSEDAELADQPAPLSLRVVLGMEGHPDGGDVVSEPYCLTWKTQTGPRALSCEVLGGVVAAPAAAGRGVDLIWLPGNSDTGGRLLPLVEYFASSRRGEREHALKETRSLGDPAAVSALPEPPAGDASPEPRSAPTSDPPAPSVPSPLPTVPDLPAFPVFPMSPVAGPGAVESREAELLLRPERRHADVRHVSCHPGRSALVSVRYLPARVAIARALRSHGWFVIEAADTGELPVMLQRVHHNAIFAEAPERPAPGWMEALGRARDAGIRVVSVASRLRGATNNPLRALGEVPRLLYPFQEAELERLIESPVLPDGR